MRQLTKGERVIVHIDDPSHQYKKYHGQKGFIYKVACDWNPIPIVKFDNGRMLAIEKKHLKYLKQQDLF